MIFDAQSEGHLRSWLVRTLEPICDAEPGALADYVIALLRHSGPEAEMRKELQEQLEEFLEKEGPPFIDQLFAALRSKSYLPYSAASPPPTPSGSALDNDNGIPIPLDGLLTPSIPSPERGRKRSFDFDERDGRPPAKSARVSNDGQFSRYSNGRGDHRSTGSWGARPERFPRGNREFADPMDSGMMGMAGGMNGRLGQAYQPPGQKRGICRDYFHKGYCARGAMCKFSHGEDAVVPGQLLPMNGQMGGMPFGPMSLGGGGAYDPNERMDMRPPGGGRMNRAPLLPRVQQEGGGSQVLNPPTSGELPVIQDLTPRVPEEDNGETKNGDVYQTRNGQQGGRGHVPMDVEMSLPMPMPMPMHMPMRGPSRGAMRGRGRGGMFSAEVHNFRPERKRDDKTLVVEKIPQDKLSLDAVNGWFKQFGTVTNVAIDTHTSKALVSFSTHDEAHAAWRSEEAVFGNRFVKVFWHRPMEGHGQLGQRLLAASAPVVANMSTKEDSPAAPGLQPSGASPAGRKPSTSSSAAALAAKQQLLEQQISEQKTLMEKLATSTGEEKKEVLARLRQLGQEIKATMSSPGSSLPYAASLTPTVKQKTPTPGPADLEQKEKERLDKELELHAVATAAEGESTEGLKAKLAKLQAEAASLGLSEGSSSYGSTFHRPYRGRGRGGRGFYRGAMRGGPPRTSLKLDNRPKKLLIKGAPSENVQGVRDWYEATGHMESLETLDNGDIVVSFKSRGAAEQGLAKGTNIPSVGQVRISWFTGQSAGTAADTSASATQDASESMPPYDMDTRHSPPVQEEVTASGWGDEEDGMGLL
ncbi:hypothetical protein GLOTRDRAFT_118964 [Gloeophyllum trabeum ATCC 11539]|uniref:C3H1-type domain-containing protein n=1 Tax=Gloeophyllum trabeum (strain ATCC 11539 / FP-39264 / Madison 617) TaxID=670483 RepID=S7QMY0_GLOTA|nr:uncharacterized protein GLOTRDRAFT_118964 [Gloeophyllum trabeum ATCC 11539]EPQ60916.1 hypothetical protein GLOTRDRAFT_118964 [Gloeophyllum trabeum ATCC 11539]